MPLPSRIRCGHLRSAVRSVYPDLTPVQELSVKTVSKLEKKPCDRCSQEAEDMVSNYKEERFRSTPPLDREHLARFKKAVSCNVRRGWNLGHYPYFPTGSATLHHTRREGGSWRAEDFSRSCRVESVFTSSKNRIVTVYSGYNSEVLSPLHDALYASFQREGWLLVGSPTDEQVQRLNGDGDFVSVDYKNATDNIRSEYCRTMIAVLKEKALGLSAEEIRCLDVVGELRFSEDGPAAVRGQPMGSKMSFPLLCLINKACVDLALSDCVQRGETSWKKFRVHRCLINGDDLLLREFNSSSGVLAGVVHHGSLAGLVVNEDKTMVSPDWAEVNSTAFFQGRKQKKTNVSVLEWDREVSDPVGFIADSVCKPSSFRQMLPKWALSIKRAWPKIQGPVPPKFLRELWRYRRELTFRPSGTTSTPNPFPVVTKPAGYDLTRGEEVCYISERVARLRSNGYVPQRLVVRRAFDGVSVPIQQALRKEKPCVEDNILKVLADAWYEKTKEKLWLEDDAGPVWDTVAFTEEPRIVTLIDHLRAFKQRKFLQCATADVGLPSPGSAQADSREPPGLSLDFVEL